MQFPKFSNATIGYSLIFIASIMWVGTMVSLTTSPVVTALLTPTSPEARGLAAVSAAVAGFFNPGN